MPLLVFLPVNLFRTTYRKATNINVTVTKNPIMPRNLIKISNLFPSLALNADLVHIINRF